MSQGIERARIKQFSFFRLSLRQKQFQEFFISHNFLFLPFQQQSYNKNNLKSSLISIIMFAPARNKPKPTPKNDKQSSLRKPVFKNNRLAVVNKQINKQSSMRTFQPFVYCPSSSEKNSIQRSVMGSQENYSGGLMNQAQESLGRYGDGIDMEQIDQAMREILESIRKEKTEISMRIMKMKAKAIEQRRHQLMSIETADMGTSATFITQDFESSKPTTSDGQFQTQDNLGFEQFQAQVRLKMHSLGLSEISVPYSLLIAESEQHGSNGEINANKAVISLLLNLMNSE